MFREISLISEIDCEEVVKIIFARLDCISNSYSIFYEYYDYDLRNFQRKFELD